MSIPEERPEEITMPVAVHESWLPLEHPYHRPRHGRRQRAALICALVFFLAPTLAFAAGVRPGQIENHQLASFPSLSDGFGFFTSLSPWATDHLSLRESGIQAEDGISRGVFGEIPPKMSGSDTGPLATSPDASAGSAEGGNDEKDKGKERRREQYPEVIQGSDNWLYYGYDAASKCLPSRSLSDMIAAIEQFKRIVEKSGRRVVIVIPPDKTTILPDHLPRDFPGKDCMIAYRDHFWDRVVDSRAVIDLRPTLSALQQRSANPIYFRTDTHWQDSSAIAALKKIAEKIQPNVTRGWKVSPAQLDQRNGDLAMLSGSNQQESWQRFSLSPDGKTDREMTDPAPLNQVSKVTNRLTKGMIAEPTALLGDSFSLGIGRYAANSFANIKFGGYALIPDQNKIDDMIVDSKIVVLEMLERGVASGDAGFLRPEALRNLEVKLKDHPIR